MADSSSTSNFAIKKEDIEESDNSPSSVSPQSKWKYFYCMVNNIPNSFHTTDLRNFFSEYMEAKHFDMFHYRHRPQFVNVADRDDNKDKGGGATTSSQAHLGNNDNDKESERKPTSSSSSSSVKRCCCPIRLKDDLSRNRFIKRYHLKYWMDKKGDDLPTRCIITKVNLTEVDLEKFANKELHPPKFMPRGNIGTPNEHFLTLIRDCRLPPSLIKKLGLEFPRGRVFKRYSKVPMDYGTNVVSGDDEEEDDANDDVKTGKGHSITDVYVAKSIKSSSTFGEGVKQNDSDNESHADDDDDRCEEWERHEALHNHRTTHGDVTSESKERLYEPEIELQWEKGGPGLVWYTDAQFWDQQRGSFEERTADDWDVDMEGYYEPGGGDKDAQDFMDIRRSQRIQKGEETLSVIKPTAPVKTPYKRKIKVGSKTELSNIGEFEKHTRGIGRKVMEKCGWKDGNGLGKTLVGIADALESEGQGPADKRGFGFYGEKLDLGNPSKRKRQFKDYDIEAEDRIVIGTIYDKPEDLDVSEPLTRRNDPTFVKRYEVPRAPASMGNFAKLK